VQEEGEYARGKLVCLGSHLAEFMWRKHVAGEDVFEALLAAIVAFWPPESQV
jgi:hypothetical protein